MRSTIKIQAGKAWIDPSKPKPKKQSSQKHGNQMASYTETKKKERSIKGALLGD
jgi:hypothetical protein